MRIKVTVLACLLLLLSGTIPVAGSSQPSDPPLASPVPDDPAPGYFAAFPGTEAKPKGKRDGITAMATSDWIQAGNCTYNQEVDNAHISNEPPLAASSHGWWNQYYITNCPEYANVDTYLQAWWCDIWGCRWETVASNTGDIRQGGGSGKRVTARRNCSGTSLVGYRSYVDVDLIGVSDPPGYTYSEPQNLNCYP